MTERERTVIRIVGLAVHALGFIGVVTGVLMGAWALGMASVLAFVVGGVWGWGMVRASVERERIEREQRRADDMARERMGLGGGGFSARFDDEAEPIVAPPGARGASGGMP
jgi:uncharacterized membrane protein